MRRVSLLLCVAATLFSFPLTAGAAGALRKGLEIDQATALNMTTGHDQSEWRWYTLGLQPGTLNVHATLKGYGRAIGASYGIELYLMRGKTTLYSSSIGCFRRQRHCNKTLHLKYHITRRGVYYVFVAGEAAETISYHLKITGPIYPLHCRKYC